jgi:hypothetical protein
MKMLLLIKKSRMCTLNRKKILYNFASIIKSFRRETSISSSSRFIGKQTKKKQCKEIALEFEKVRFLPLVLYIAKEPK